MINPKFRVIYKGFGKRSPEKFYEQIQESQAKNIAEGRKWYSKEIEEYYNQLMKIHKERIKNSKEDKK